MRRTTLLWALVALACTGLVAENCAAKTRIGAEKAKSVAFEFFEAVRWDSKGDVRVEALDDDYLVRSGDATARVDAFTSRILYADIGEPNYNIQPPKNPISREAARKKAIGYLKIAGLYSADAKPESIKPSGVRFQRYYKGYPFSHGRTTVGMYPGDGSLDRLETNTTSAPLPTSIAVNISKKRAQSIAAKLLGDLPDLKPVSQKLMIVQPNNYWGTDPKAKRDALQNISRLAWVCYFNWDRDHVACVHVDAATGKVLGGMRCK